MIVVKNITTFSMVLVKNQRAKLRLKGSVHWVLPWSWLKTRWRLTLVKTSITLRPQRRTLCTGQGYSV